MLHRGIAIMCILAAAHAACKPMYNLLTNENILNTLLTPYMTPMA